MSNNSSVVISILMPGGPPTTWKTNVLIRVTRRASEVSRNMVYTCFSLILLSVWMLSSSHRLARIGAFIFRFVSGPPGVGIDMTTLKFIVSFIHLGSRSFQYDTKTSDVARISFSIRNMRVTASTGRMSRYCFTSIVYCTIQKLYTFFFDVFLLYVFRFLSNCLTFFVPKFEISINKMY
jgi:hypothetical protein